MTRLRIPLLAITLVVLSLAFTTAASAVALNDLDASYGAGGISPLAPTIDSVSVIRTALQPDNKLLVGYTLDGEDGPLITRLNVDGSVDASFGTGGTIAVARATSETIYLDEILVAANGTVFVTGTLNQSTAPGSPWTPTVWAHTSTGAIIPAFGTLGRKIFAQVGSSTNYLRGSAFAPSGDILLSYQAPNGANKGIGLAVMRQDGVVPINVVRGETGVDVDASSMAVTASGRILVGANYGALGSGLVKIYAFNPAGAVDSGWGTGGVQNFGLNGTHTGIYGLEAWGDQAVAYGYSASGASLTFYEADGKLSQTAGPSGTNRFNPFNGTFSYIYGASVTPAGQLLTVGQSSTGADGQAFIARLNFSGALDQTVPTNGVAPIHGVKSTTFSIDRQTDGKYLTASIIDGSRRVSIRRMWGEAQPQAATAGFARSIKSKMKAKKLKTIKGTATGTELTKVEIAIQKVDTKQLKKKKRCTFVKSTRTTVKKVKAVKGKCLPSVWIPATGTASWFVKLKRVLKPGKYVISVRASGLAGVGAVTSKKVKLTK